MGRGLEEVFADTIGPQRAIAIASISPNPRQPRQKPQEAGIQLLAESIRKHGLLQPLIVSEQTGQPGKYHLVAGERRWRAARVAGLEAVPATVVKTDDRGQLELALVENLQRTDLGPLERARAYRALVDDFDQTQEGVAAALGVSRPSVANALRLLSLDPATRTALAEDRITEGHARALLAVVDIDDRVRLLAAIEAEGLSVREAERRTKARQTDAPSRSAGEDTTEWNQEITAQLDRIQRRLGTKARLRGGEQRGRIELEYYSGEELAILIERLNEV